MTTKCDCGAELVNGRTLCDLCQAKAETILEYLPVYFRNLARWRPPNRPNGSLAARGSWLLRQGESTAADPLAPALDLAAGDLAVWAGRLVAARPYLARLLARLEASRAAESVDEVQAVAWLCAGFRRHLGAVSTLGWAGEFVRDLDYHERRLRALTEEAVPGWYAGACRRCGVATYVVPGLTWVTCSSCGTATTARDHLEVVLDEARDWRARPMRLAEAVVALIDTEPSVPRLHERIRKWHQRGRLEAIDSLGYVRELGYAGERYAPKQHRLGDVLDLVLATPGDARADTPMDGGRDVVR